MSEKVEEAIVDFANNLEAACVQLKRYIGEAQGVGIHEEQFSSLKWERHEGNKLGEFETATKEANPGDLFGRCLNILKVNGATIKSRFHEKNWAYAYWLYSEKPGVIYRKALRKKETSR